MHRSLLPSFRRTQPFCKCSENRLTHNLIWRGNDVLTWGSSFPFYPYIRVYQRKRISYLSQVRRDNPPFVSVFNRSDAAVCNIWGHTAGLEFYGGRESLCRLQPGQRGPSQRNQPREHHQQRWAQHACLSNVEQTWLTFKITFTSIQLSHQIICEEWIIWQKVMLLKGTWKGLCCELWANLRNIWSVGGQLVSSWISFV